MCKTCNSRSKISAAYETKSLTNNRRIVKVGKFGDLYGPPSRGQ